jgi:hypothetical protein
MSDQTASESTFPRSFPVNLPGVTVEWLARANGCSARTVRRHRGTLPPDARAVAPLLTQMGPALAVRMAQLRPPRGVLPLWSRLGIAELAAGGATYAELMAWFGTSRSTVYRAIHCAPAGFSPLTGERMLTTQQAARIDSR